jgi:hypothetical protein
VTRPYPIIGIAGQAGSGKDTAGSFLLSFLGGYTYGFADPVKRMLAQIGVDLSDPYWEANKDKKVPLLGVSPRRLMQTLATEWGQGFVRKDIWLIMAQDRFLRSGRGMIVTDVRFEHEADWVRRSGGRIVHLIGRKYGVEAHSSEEQLNIDPADFVLNNSGSRENLQDDLKALFSGQHQA